MKNHWKFILLLLICAFFLLINVGSYGLIESSDARYAEIARAMYLSGDYIHPNYMEVHHYHKPPFTYQITALGYQLFGINTFGARFFLQMAILIQLILVYALTLQLFNKKETALWAAMIYMTFPLVLMASRSLTTDAFLSMFALLSIYAWVRYRKGANTPYLYLFTISLAFGFLTKGPVVFLIPLIFIIIYNRIEPAKKSFGKHHFFAWFIFIAVAFSWFIYLIIQNYDFLNYFLGHQTADRFSKNVFGRTEPYWYFLLFAPIAGLPWLIVLPYLVKVQKVLFTKKSLYLTLLLAVLIPLIFFSLSSSKRILYILPFYGLLAILTAQLFNLLSEEKSKLVNKIILGYALIILLAFAATLVIETKFILPKELGIAAIFILIPIVWIYKNAKMTFKFRAITISFIISLFLVINSGIVFSANEQKLKSMKPIADFIIKKGLRDRDIIVYDLIRPSLAFHLNKSIISVYYWREGLNRETEFEEDLNFKKYLLNGHKEEDKAYLKQVTKAPTVLLIYRYDIAKWLKKEYKHKELMGEWSIYY